MVPTGDQDRVSLDDPADDRLGHDDRRRGSRRTAGPAVRRSAATGSAFAARIRNGSGGARPRTGSRCSRPRVSTSRRSHRSAPEWTPPLYADAASPGPDRCPACPGQQLRVEAGRVSRQARVLPPGRALDARRPACRGPIAERRAHVVVGARDARLHRDVRRRRRSSRGTTCARGAATGAARSSSRRSSRSPRSASGCSTRSTSPIRTSRWRGSSSASRSGRPACCGCSTWRSSPTSGGSGRRRVVSWSRLMARQWRDPLVGRDILFGVALGALIHVIDLGSGAAGLTRLGHTRVAAARAVARRPARHALRAGAEVGNQVFNAVLNALFVRLRHGPAEDRSSGGSGRPSTVAIALFTLHLRRAASDDGQAWAINLTPHRPDRRASSCWPSSTWACSRRSILFLVDFIIVERGVHARYVEVVLRRFRCSSLADSRHDGVLRVLRLARRRAAAGSDRLARLRSHRRQIPAGRLEDRQTSRRPSMHRRRLRRRSPVRPLQD